MDKYTTVRDKISLTEQLDISEETTTTVASIKMANAPDFTFFHFFVPRELHVTILEASKMANMDFIPLLEEL